MTPTTEEQRAEFEAWAKEKGLIQESFGIRSVSSMCEIAESAWQAATAAASRRSPPPAAEGVEGKPLMMREQIMAIAEEAGFVCVKSCCGVPLKFCSGDEWRGDLNVFATKIIRAAITKAGKKGEA